MFRKTTSCNTEKRKKFDILKGIQFDSCQALGRASESFDAFDAAPAKDSQGSQAHTGEVAKASHATQARPGRYEVMQVCGLLGSFGKCGIIGLLISGLRNSAPRMENQMENNMKNEMNTGIMQWFIGIRVSKVSDSLLGGLIIEILIHGVYVGHCVH